METSGLSKIPQEMFNQCMYYLFPSDLLPFRATCKHLYTTTFPTIAQTFFSSLKTSLMGSDVEKLEGISRHPKLREYIKTLYIEDDAAEFDPWCVSVQPALGSSHLWPRNEGGILDLDSVRARNLRMILADRKLCPEMIRFRDWNIGSSNFHIYPDSPGVLKYRTGAIAPISVLAREVIDGADLCVTSIVMQRVDTLVSSYESSALATGVTTSVSGPCVYDLIFHLSPRHQGQNTGFSLLHSARLDSPYGVDAWLLEEILCHAPALEDLQLAVRQTWETILPTKTPFPPRLRQLELRTTTLHAETLLHLLQNSKDSLKSLTIRSTTLSPGSTWRDVLSRIGNDLSELEFFWVNGLREGGVNARLTNFLGFGQDPVAEEYGAGLRVIEKGRPENPPPGHIRLQYVRYEGPDAASVVRCVAGYAR